MLADVAALWGATDFRDPLLPLWAMEMIAKVFLYAWLFCMGATVGSFLNVVIYRLPRGKNLAYPGSLCPHCGHPIRLQDNIPILSWLSLRGRCRDCGGPISSRYFWVELTVACLFLLVLVAEQSLPIFSFGLRTRQLLTIRDGAAFWCMYFVHAALFTTLIAAILIRADGFSVPASLFLPIALVAFALPLLWPEIRSVPALTTQTFTRWQAGMIDGLLGLVGGLLVAGVLVWPARRFAWKASTVVAACCSVTIVLGWQRGIPAAALALPLCPLAAWLVRTGRATLPSGSLDNPLQTEQVQKTSAPLDPAPQPLDPP